MKTLITFLLILSPLTSVAAPKNFPDIPPDADSSFYRSVKNNRLSAGVDDGLDGVVSLGERNLKWLDYINSFRPVGQKLSLTSKDTQRGIPIDKPSEYNVQLVQQKLVDLKPQIPAEMQKVIFENADFTKEPPVAIVDYLTASRELDRVFQSALRWRTMAPWLNYLAENRHSDLRGWYFLSRMADRESKLKDFANQDAETKAKLRGWLVNMCFNNDSNDTTANCERIVDSQISGGQSLEAYYQSKAARSSEMFKDYFTIPSNVSRPEIRWFDDADGKSHVEAPFHDPGTDAVRSFLKDNIEDEWHFGEWHLLLPFQNSSGIPHVVFAPGVTPHVNELGGDEITMNSSQPLTEYDAQWTIRHEYGHVLGFPDCYVEFYEAERNVIVNYQFDIDNLMCSRRGHIKATHMDEMKRIYSR